MDNKKYEALINIYETGSITRTAELMGYTQSGVTQMVNSLETELGIRLLRRTNKGTKLTQNGLRLLPYMREEFRWERTIQQECSRMTGKDTGTVNVGCLSSISAQWMPEILGTFATTFPNIKINMLEHEAPELKRMLKTGRIDLALMEIDEKSNFITKTLTHDEIFAVVPENHPLTKQKWVKLEELARYPFISYAFGETDDIDQLWPETVTQNKVKFNVMYTCKNDITALNMVKHNLGVSIAGNLMIAERIKGIAKISLNPPIHRTLGIARLDNGKMLPATESFMECVIKTIGRE